MKGGFSLVHKLGIVLCITLAWGILGQSSASAQSDAVSVSLTSEKYQVVNTQQREITNGSGAKSGGAGKADKKSEKKKKAGLKSD